MLLITPAAYHRIHEAGENTENFHKVASRLLLAALVFLGPGMAGDLFVVIAKQTQSAGTAGAIAGVCYWRSMAYRLGSAPGAENNRERNRGTRKLKMLQR